MGKTLILGGAGFIGQVLVKTLHEAGFDVRVMDCLLYEEERQVTLPCEFIIGDICEVRNLQRALRGVDHVVNLAAISNDPASDLDPIVTWRTNFKANELLAEMCAFSGIRVVYASSCSVYGFNAGDMFYETSKMNPVTLYARTKALSERVYERFGQDLQYYLLRLATVFGDSPKPRFDLVVNTMAVEGYFNKVIRVNGGNQWRPVVHVKDVANAISLMLHNDKPGLANQIYNVGSQELNYRIEDIGRAVHSVLAECHLDIRRDDADPRSYRVSFDKIRKSFDFTTQNSIEDGVREIVHSAQMGRIPDLYSSMYYRVKYLKDKGIN